MIIDHPWGTCATSWEIHRYFRSAFGCHTSSVRRRRWPLFQRLSDCQTDFSRWRWCLGWRSMEHNSNNHSRHPWFLSNQRIPTHATRPNFNEHIVDSSRQSPWSFLLFTIQRLTLSKHHASSGWPMIATIDSTGLLLALGLTFFCIFSQNWILLILVPIIGYGFAWLGHFFVQKNKPATFQWPLYSIMGDFKMVFLTIIGKWGRK